MACSGEFSEAKDSGVCLDDCDSQVVEALIHYLYNFDYGEYAIRKTDMPSIVLDARLFAIADVYFVLPPHKFDTLLSCSTRPNPAARASSKSCVRHQSSVPTSQPPLLLATSRFTSAQIAGRCFP